MKKFSDLKIWVRLTIVTWLMLVVAWSGMVLWGSRINREAAIAQAQDFSRSVREMALAGLTGMMITGTVGQREVFLDQIKQLSVIKDLKVIRGNGVINQFGPGKAGESASDAIERRVMETGQEYTEVLPGADGDSLRVVFPALASKNYLGKNCLTCHTVAEGSVLGVVSMQVSLSRVDAAAREFSIKIFGAAVLLSLPLLGFMYLFIRRFVTRPLDEMAAGLRDMAAGKGDLTRRLEVRSADEIGEVCSVFNQMMDQFSGLVRQVGNTSNHVFDAARQLTAGAGRVAGGSQRQTEQSASAAAAVEQVVASISAIARSAEAVHDLARESLERSGQGNESLERLMGQMRSVESAVAGIADSVNQFMQSTDAISVMTREVKDIAEQTNLLALNAAIEAARAGEQGRGFAVVADEVRKLAEKSARSALEIDAITRKLGQQSVAVKDAISDGLEHLTNSRASADAVQSVLSAASDTVAQVGRGLDEIALATEEQHRVSAHVAANIESIAAMARDNRGAVDQTTQAAQLLESLSVDLKNGVGRFVV
ncbi:MAG: methyl-accepting chemotaxis protein [Rhodocyclaceae bacterium]|nr:methyl-accepting chemotaxis protein [Rhodocyclaceae bacterium]